MVCAVHQGKPAKRTEDGLFLGGRFDALPGPRPTYAESGDYCRRGGTLSSKPPPLGPTEPAPNPSREPLQWHSKAARQGPLAPRKPQARRIRSPGLRKPADPRPPQAPRATASLRSEPPGPGINPCFPGRARTGVGEGH